MTVPSIQVGTGGPATKIAGLTSSLSGLGANIRLACQVFPGFGPNIPILDAVEVTDFRAGWPLRYGPNGVLRRVLPTLVSNADMVHNHGVWMAINRYATESAVDEGKPLITSTDGMFEKAAFNKSWFLKEASFLLWTGNNLLRTSCFHATSEQECRSIRGRGFTRQPVAVIPNGVAILEPGDVAETDELLREWPWLEGRRIILFLGRIHPFKRPEMLVAAWRRCRVEKDGIILLLAGPVADGFTRFSKRLDMLIGAGDDVRVLGPLDGRLKYGLLSRADVMVLPSRSENFGTVVAEALMCGTPVIANRNAPWRSLEERDCGWWVEPDEEGLTRALEEVFSLPKATLKQMGERGRRLAVEHFSWPRVASQMKAVYQWMMGGGSRPDCVVTD